MRCAISVSTSRGVKSTSRLTKLKRVPRTPAACISLQLGVGDVAIDRRHAARPVVRRAQRVDERAVVGAVAGGLHDDVLVEAEAIAQREELLLRRIARRVLPLRRVRELVAGAEHVAVRVHRAGGNLERRDRRIRVKRQPAGCDFERSCG